MDPRYAFMAQNRKITEIPAATNLYAYACIFEFHNGRAENSLSLKAREFKKVNEIDEFEYQVICP